MNWGFTIGELYSRKNVINKRLRPKNHQAGISVSTVAPVVILAATKAGEKDGYKDELHDDGGYTFYGQKAGENGWMDNQNPRVQNHRLEENALLAFKQVGALYRFLGEFQFASVTPIDVVKDGVTVQQAVFKLTAVEDLNQILFDEAVERRCREEDDLAALRQRAFEAAVEKPGRKGAKPRSVFERSVHVAAYVLKRAKGVCEADQSHPAPFDRSEGVPYLEPHHIHRLTDGGPDDPRSVIALCPNCHRKAHSWSRKDDFKAELLTRMKVIEQSTN